VFPELREAHLRVFVLKSTAAVSSSSRLVNALSVTLGISFLALVTWCGGARGLVYAALYGVALVPGLPIGWRLFGRRHPAGWVSGAIVGYGLTSLALWLPIRLGYPASWAFVIAWAAVTIAAWGILPRREGELVSLPPFTRRDALAWVILLQLVVLFLAFPFGRLGERDTSGRRYYRAYFTADFIWHTALTQEIARREWPPRNPYYARDPVHYYWTYYLVPAVLSGPPARPLVDVETALILTALGQALLMFSLVYFAAWSACSGRAGPAFAASLIALMAPSFEGLYKVVQFMRRGVPFDALRDLNIDAISAWDFRGLRIDGLVRSMWYTPQHETSFALGLVAVLVASRLARTARWPTVLLAGIALGLSVAMNPVLGAAFCAIYGTTVLIDVVARRLPFAALWLQGLAIVPVLLALGWCVASEMGSTAGAHLFIGWLYDTRAPILTLFLSLGGLLLPALAGLLPSRVPFRPALPAVPGLVVGLGLLYFVSLSDRSWVGFRAGNILQVVLPMLAARAFAALADRGGTRVLTATAVILVAAGAPTTLIDTYNAQDVANLRQGPGFKWTLVLSPDQQAAYEWIRHSTPPDAVIQADPLPRDRKNWSVIPTFAARRMAAGLAIPLLPEPQQEGLPERAHAIITRLPLAEAHTEAQALGIDYLYLDGDDEGGAAVRDRFRARPELFTEMFRRGDVVVYAVRR
jgi:hypothetical protein